MATTKDRRQHLKIGNFYNGIKSLSKFIKTNLYICVLDKQFKTLLINTIPHEFSFRIKLHKRTRMDPP